MKLNICMLLPEPYVAGMPARPPVIEMSAIGTRLGHKVIWIMPNREGGKEIRQEQCGGTRIFTIPFSTYTSPSLIRKILGKLLFTWKEARLASRVIREEGCNIIQARDDISEGLVAVYLKRKFKIPFVFRLINPISGFSSEKYKLGSGGLFYLVAKVERLVMPYILRQADLVLPVSKWMQEGLGIKGIPKSKVLPVTNAVNTKLFSSTINGEDVRREYNLGNSIVVIYIGTLDKLRHLNILIYSLAQIRQSKHLVKLLVLGQGNDSDNLEKLANSLGVGKDVIFAGQISYFEVPRFIAAANIGISPVPPLDIYKTSSPLKLLEYMAMAKPVVTNEEIYEQAELLKQSGGGILVPFTPGAFARAIIKLLDNPEEATEMGRRGREWVMKNRSYEILAQQVEKRYLALIKK